MKKFSLEDLSRCNGENGQPVYVAHQGKVYDLSGSKMWRKGVHMKRHHAGADMTTDIQAAPHGPDKLEAFPCVGTLPSEAPDEDIPRALAWLLGRFPMLRRHPHPMTVHFPIAFFMAAPVFDLLYLATGASAFETTAWHCLGAGVLFLIVAMCTGFYTWWLNFKARPLPAVHYKIMLASTILVISVIAFIWRTWVPDLFATASGGGLVYLLLNLALLPLVTALGWFGAQLTFPIERD